jgi:hypothetical protein
MLTKEEQEILKKQIKNRLTEECSYCFKRFIKSDFSFLYTYKGNICIYCQEKDNY